jgi:transcriptional regulator with XRE-family HTH domain
MQRFGEKLRILREHKGISQRQLAKQFGISNSFLSNIEHGMHHPNVALLVQIANYFGVKVDVLVLDELELAIDDE